MLMCIHEAGHDDLPWKINALGLRVRSADRFNRFDRCDCFALYDQRLIVGQPFRQQDRIRRKDRSVIVRLCGFLTIPFFLPLRYRVGSSNAHAMQGVILFSVPAIAQHHVVAVPLHVRAELAWSLLIRMRPKIFARRSVTMKPSCFCSLSHFGNGRLPSKQSSRRSSTRLCESRSRLGIPRSGGDAASRTGTGLLRKRRPKRDDRSRLWVCRCCNESCQWGVSVRTGRHHSMVEFNSKKIPKGKSFPSS